MATKKKEATLEENFAELDGMLEKLACLLYTSDAADEL